MTTSSYVTPTLLRNRIFSQELFRLRPHQLQSKQLPLIFIVETKLLFLLCYQKLVSDKLDLFWSLNLFFILIMQSRKSIQAAFVEKKNFSAFSQFLLSVSSTKPLYLLCFTQMRRYFRSLLKGAYRAIKPSLSGVDIWQDYNVVALVILVLQRTT